MTVLASSSLREDAPKPPAFAEVYGEHAAFVWRSLRRLGVRDADVEDVCQETFVVVYKKLSDFKGGSARAWLFAIAVRVASDYRKRAHVRHEVTSEELPEAPVEANQHVSVDRARAARLLEDILATLDDEKRAIFVGYELEQMSMAEIAAVVDCPLQTAYSRLHAAREHVTSAIERWNRRERSRV